MKSGVGVFNKKASEMYSALPQSEKDRLVKLSGDNNSTEVMSPKDVIKAGTKAFKIIHKQVLSFVFQTFRMNSLLMYSLRS